MATQPRQQFEGFTRTRLALAAVACGPLAGLVLMLIIGIINLLFTAASGGYSTFPPQAILSGAIFGAAFGWPSMLVFGLPAHRLLYRRGSRKAGGYLLAGVIAGFVIGVLMAVVFLPIGAVQNTGELAGAAGVIGLICMLGAVMASWFFWLIRRPDKDVQRAASVAAAFE